MLTIKAWSAEQAAELIGCSRAKIFQEIRAGRLVARKLGRKTLILDEDVNAYLRALPPRKVAPLHPNALR